MSMIRIARVVKYKGVVYPANTDIVVDDRDVSDLLSRGGWIINKGPAVKPTVEDAEATTTTNEEEVEGPSFLQNVITEKLKEEANKEPVSKKSKKA